MAKLHGGNYSRKEILTKAGSVKQAFSLREIQYTGGDANLTKAYLVSNGSGLEFSVNTNKCLDIFDMKYKGVNLAFLSKAELNSPYVSDNRSSFYTFAQGCGMLYTAGLANVGKGDDSGPDAQYYHGMIKNRSAENVCAKGEWDGDDYTITISGEVKESAFYGRNLSLKRTIEATAGESCIRICDTIENLDFKPDELMLLYHLNLGFPLLDEGCQFGLPAKDVLPLSDYSAEKISEYQNVTAPFDGEAECVYAIAMHTDEDGYTMSYLYNPRLQMALYVRYDANALPWLVEWKSMRSGDYAFGMLPSSCKPIGITQARKEGGVKVLNPFETWEINMEIGVTDDPAQIAQIKAQVEALSR